jgi:hypothetical protein
MHHMTCAQKIKCDAASDGEPRCPWLDLYVRPITKEESDAFILKYEFLGSIGHPQARYGAICPFTGRLAAVETFGGPSYRTPGQIVLERGATSPWANISTPTWFINRACRAAFMDHGWRVFKAYADPAAGEVGEVYQLSGWRYVGQEIGRGTIGGQPRPRDYFTNGRETISDKGWRKRGFNLTDATDLLGYERKYTPAKHVYVHIERHGLNERELRELWAKQLPELPPPKRPPDDNSL